MPDNELATLHDAQQTTLAAYGQRSLTPDYEMSDWNARRGEDLAPMSSPERPLNVADALGYLDSVKIQFQDRPNVYNRFLDIMKDFKSQLIDTPGVIQRVSNLFHGHPMLIQGFNTFLPAGYRIETGTDLMNPNFITVTTPAGTTTQATNSVFTVDGINRGYSGTPIPESDIEPALLYLQKVKARYSNDPERYRNFLELLSPEKFADEEVVSLVRHIFRDDTDLIRGFYQFLPERGLQKHIAQLDDIPERPKGAERSKKPSSALPQKRKRKAPEKEKETSAKGGPTKRTKQQHNVPSEAPSPALSQRRAAVPPSPRRVHPVAHNAPIIVHHQPPLSHVNRGDGGQFFDRVKRFLDNRETYNEFLKLVNLFTQDILDTVRLVNESRSYLGDGELLEELKEILCFDQRMEARVDQEDVWTRPTGVLDRPSRDQLHERFGSYRKLPAYEVNVTCAGRDAMCRSVLNDEWISQPTFASEDSGFIAHKKNIYEEALHRSEEERHEYDFHIEAINRTIQWLEPFNNKIMQLNNEERTTYKPKPNINSSAKSIYLRVIKKIYGRDAGLDVFQAISEVPGVAIPVVLARLKQKHEEWKHAQREWNKVWREVDARNYQKSLDHQGITFKMQDKKAITSKYFVNQIEAARDEQQAKRAALIDPLFARTRPRHQLEFILEDMATLQDAVKLTCSFLDRTQGQIALGERKKIESFLRMFVPTFFMLDHAAWNACFTPRSEAVEGENGEVDHASEDTETSNASGSKGRNGNNKKGVVAGGSDLRKRLLKSEQAKSSRRTRASSSRPVSPAIPDSMLVDTESPPSNGNGETGTNGPRRGTFFTNTTFYVLFRLLELLYSRMLLFKNISNGVANDPSLHKPINPVPTNLGLGILTDVSKMTEQGADAVYFYDLFLDSCERLFDNDLEQNVFEDQMRYMFGIKDAYKAFTVDKVTGAIVKQVQNAIADPKSQDLFDLLRREREISSPTSQDQINARKSAERVVGPDENIFRMDWHPDSKMVTIQLLGKDDSNFDDSEVMTGRWQSYVDSYITPEETIGVTASAAMRRPFLRKTRISSDGFVPKTVANGTLGLRVCTRTYRLFWVPRSEEYLFRLYPSSKQYSEGILRSRVRNDQRKAWLEKWLERKPSTPPEVTEEPAVITKPSDSTEVIPDEQPGEVKDSAEGAVKESEPVDKEIEMVDESKEVDVGSEVVDKPSETAAEKEKEVPPQPSEVAVTSPVPTPVSAPAPAVQPAPEPKPAPEPAPIPVTESAPVPAPPVPETPPPSVLTSEPIPPPAVEPITNSPAEVAEPASKLEPTPISTSAEPPAAEILPVPASTARPTTPPPPPTGTSTLEPTPDPSAS
ncbi:Transcriptional regulatory protein Sin3-like protein [Abortiporus biennis]